MSAIIISCADNYSDESSMSFSEYTENAELKSDLRQFGLDYENAYSEVLYCKSRTDTINKELITALQGLDKCIDNFKKEHDIFGDLTISQKEHLYISEDSARLMVLDTDVLLEFYKKNKSEEFYWIARRYLKEGHTGLSIDDIVEDDELYLNEKFTLLTLLPAEHASLSLTRSGSDWPKWLDDAFSPLTNEVTNAINNAKNKNSKDEDDEEEKKKKECAEQYQKDLELCEGQHRAAQIQNVGSTVENIGEIGAAGAGLMKVAPKSPQVETGIAIGTAVAAAGRGIQGIGTAAATFFDYEACKNQAEKDYKACLK